MSDDAEDRTTQIGLYNQACSYHLAARTLKNLRLRGTHPTAPVAFLYFHAIELFLKSFLRLHGHSVEELRKRFSHGYGAMRKRASALGFDFMNEDLVVLRYMERADAVIRARYLKTGLYEEPTPDALERTAKSLRETTRMELRSKGFPTRR